MQKYYIFLNLGPAAGPAQAYTIVLQLPIIETRAEVLLGLARVDVSDRLRGQFLPYHSGSTKLKPSFLLLCNEMEEIDGVPCWAAAPCMHCSS